MPDLEHSRTKPIDYSKIIDILNSNGTAIIPVDTVYGLITKAFNSETLNKLDKIKGARNLPYSVIFDSQNSFYEWCGEIDWIRKRIIDSLLPGPVTIVLPEPEHVKDKFRYHSTGLGIRITTDPLVKELLAQLGSPVWATSVNRSGKLAPSDFSDIDESIIREADFVHDTGKTMYGIASTSIDIRHRPFKVLREGPWLEKVKSTLEQSKKPFNIIVVCTGNICRSPIAAGILQHELGPVGNSGIEVNSAGTNAVDGYAATDKMVRIAEDWGVDITSHKARQITGDIINNTDLILTVTPKHTNLIINDYPASQSKIRLFGEMINRKSIPDPFQLGFSEYKSSAELIRAAAYPWVEEINRNLPVNLRSATRTETTGIST